MRKFINDPDLVADEMLDGYLDVHGDIVRLAAPRVIARALPHRGKVGLVSGGGSGHKPAFIGYVRQGLLDAVVVGDVFTSPPANAVLEAIRAVDTGSGVLLLLGNYSGDVMNFTLAAQLARKEGRRVELAIATDDVGAGFRDTPDMRRGVVGQVLIWKACGAAAEEGRNLAEVTSIATTVNALTRTLGVAASGCTVPTLGVPTFALGDHELEFGVGHHGERGARTIPNASADTIVDLMFPEVLDDLPFRAGDRVVTLVNGLGATPLLELYIVHRRLRQRLDGAGIMVHRSFVGEYFTALEMAGFSITLSRVDDELAQLLDAPANGVLAGRTWPA